jgi:hypothetical protein
VYIFCSQVVPQEHIQLIMKKAVVVFLVQLENIQLIMKMLVFLAPSELKVFCREQRQKIYVAFAT